MKHRLLVFLGVFVAVLASSSPGLAGSMDPTFQFTNTTGGPVSRADFAIIPAGSVQPPVIGTDPVTGLPQTSSPVVLDPSRSSGFDFNNFSTALGTGNGIQGLRLLFGQKQTIENGQVVFQPVFGPNGEPPRFLDNGGVVTFSLHLDPTFTGTVTLKSLTTGIKDPTLLPPNTSGTPVPPPQIPEPATMTLWACIVTALAALRRSRPWQRLAARA